MIKVKLNLITFLYGILNIINLYLYKIKLITCLISNWFHVQNLMIFIRVLNDLPFLRKTYFINMINNLFTRL
jgi:hypothetical protein